MSDMYGVIVLFLLFILMPATIILSIAYAIKYVKHEHEWEKVIDDTLVADSNNVKSHVVVYMCKKCGKKVKTKV